jgi:hypothetical protein
MAESPSNKDLILVKGSSGELLQISVEHLKNDYIIQGMSPSDLAHKYDVPIKSVDKLIREHKLGEIRRAHIKNGLIKIQNIQVGQAEKLMKLETEFKRIRISQLEKQLEDYIKYYETHGHFYKVHPVTSEILNDTNGIPIQIKIPNVSREIEELKQSVSLSEGLKNILAHINEIINPPKKESNIENSIIDITNYNNLFESRKDEE